MNQEEKMIRSFTDLKAWKEGHNLVVATYKATDTFPQKEVFGLTNQMRRSAVSITSNIAEGFSRQTYKEKIQFYCIAQGSLTELQNQLLIARDVDFLKKSTFAGVADQAVLVHKLLSGLIKKSKTYVS